MQLARHYTEQTWLLGFWNWQRSRLCDRAWLVDILTVWLDLIPMLWLCLEFDPARWSQQTLMRVQTGTNTG